jgi:hypothetical protein
MPSLEDNRGARVLARVIVVGAVVVVSSLVAALAIGLTFYLNRGWPILAALHGLDEIVRLGGLKLLAKAALVVAAGLVAAVGAIAAFRGRSGRTGDAAGKR